MAETKDAVMPVLQKIQKDIADFRKSSEAKANDMAENILGAREDIAEIKRDLLFNLGLTAKQRSDYVDLKAELKAMKKRLTALESRS